MVFGLGPTHNPVLTGKTGKTRKWFSRKQKKVNIIVFTRNYLKSVFLVFEIFVFLHAKTSLDFDAKDTVETVADGTVGALPVE
jgi:hypothetical protein